MMQETSIAAVPLYSWKKTGPSAQLEGISLDGNRARSSPVVRRQVECVCQRKEEGAPHTIFFSLKYNSMENPPL